MVAFVPACIATVVLVVLVEDSTGVNAPLVFSMASYINRDSILAAGITVCFANRALSLIYAMQLVCERLKTLYVQLQI